MDVDGSGNINIKELIDFLEAVGGGEIDKDVVSQTLYVFTKVTLESVLSHQVLYRLYFAYRNDY